MFNGRIVLTPQDIFEKDFKVDTRGYRLQEVDKYLDQIIKDYAEFVNIIKELKAENKELANENLDLKPHSTIWSNTPHYLTTLYSKA